MHITIAERLRPFSHLPGTYCLLPRSFLRCRIFPTKLVIDDVSEIYPKALITIDLSLHGPVKDFTIQQDLEKGFIRVWGHFQEGFVRYCLMALEEPHSFIFKMERAPLAGVNSPTFNKVIYPKEEIQVKAPTSPLTFKFKNERLSLGSHKAQDIELIRRRLDLSEIFPLWFRLGQQLLSLDKPSCEGTLKLLEICENIIYEKKALEVFQAFLNLFHVGFEGLLSPCLYDENYQGFSVDLSSDNFKGVPLYLLTEGSKLISKLFIDIKEHSIAMLPVLPPQFHCGRMLGVACGVFGEIDFEWSKKLIRRVVFNSKIDGPIHFAFQKGLKTFRLRANLKDKGVIVSCGEKVYCQVGMTYFFDNFKK